MPLSANPEKWSNTFKQIVGNLPTICLSLFDHFMNLALKGLNLLKQSFNIRRILTVHELSKRERKVLCSVITKVLCKMIQLAQFHK